MTVHLFGVVKSQSCANYALRKTADDNQSQISTQVVSTIGYNFYVEDCLKSLSSEEGEGGSYHKEGFNIPKWINNTYRVQNPLLNSAWNGYRVLER